MIPNKRFIDAMHRWHEDIFYRYDNRLARFFVQMWHRRSLKTTGILNLFIRECCRYEKLIATMVFPQLNSARDIIWTDPKMLETYLPEQSEMGYRLNNSEMNVIFSNSSLLRIRGADKLQKRRGLDTDLLDLSEYPQMKREVWSQIFRPIMAKNPRKDFVRCTFFDFTPRGDDHAIKLWNDARDRPGWYRSKLDAYMSEIIPAEELEGMQQDQLPWEFDQEMLCSIITHEERVIITTAMLHELKKHGKVVRKYTIHGLSCDPALGGDECVIYVWENERIIDQLYLHERDPMKVCGHIVAKMKEHKLKNAVIDQTGLGEGIVGRIREILPTDEGYDIVGFMAAAKAIKENRFVNVRAEAWFDVGQMIHDFEVDYPEDPTLRQQITAVHFDPMSSLGRLKAEPKEKVRERVGSPDRADAFMMWLYYHNRFQPDGESGKSEYTYRIPNSPMAA